MNYLEQLEKAIIFIETNLCEDIKVEEIAGAAGYSYFHFHRVFEAVLGETVGNYLRSRRLTKAAYDLVYTDKRILDIALDYRFESQEAFNRAFKKIYQVTPGTFRKNRMDMVLFNKKPLTRFKLKHLKTKITVQPEIKEIGKINLIGVRGKTTLRSNLIPEMWRLFNPRIEEIKNRTKGVRGYGVNEVDPDFDFTKFDEDMQFSVLVGVEVSSFADIPPGMVAKTLAGGKYAVFTHKGRVDTLRITYDYIWGTWLSCCGYEVDLRDDFEFYDERFLGPDNEESEMSIYIPLK